MLIMASHGDILMIRTILLAALAASILAACSQPDNYYPASYSYPEAALDISQDSVLAQQTTRASSQQSGPTKIAVTRGFTLRLPSNEVAAIQQRHLAECAKLGCTVLETRLDRLSEMRISARTSVRVAPNQYPAFAAVITAPPVDVTTQSERAEDMTVVVLDVDKRLEVKTALRDRLITMLKDQGSKSVADLAAIEKELAQTQGDIEVAIAQRDYL
jgi:uncharacterized cupredoxin-like copper-binding protein